MRRRVLCFGLCLILSLGAAAVPTVEAAGSLYFTAAGNEILPLDEDLMPFWSGGYLYVASSIFTGQVNKSLGVACLPSESMTNQCILYAGSRTLLFDLRGNYVRDSDGNFTYLGAIRRGNEIFVPVSVVADFFHLEYSVTPMKLEFGDEEDYGSLVWLRQPNFGLSEKDFINAASSQIVMRYTQYLQDRAPGESDGDGPTDIPQPPEEGAGKNVYLCLEAGDTAPALLDALETYEVQATFFCGAEFLGRQGALLRRMTATGQSIGLLVDADDPERTVEEQLEAGNALLER